jgi:steroid delta-isomerase-like uncharacterized protein
MSAEENKALVRRTYEEVLNKVHLDVVDELYASEYVYTSPGSPELRGPEGFKQLVRMLRAAFPDLRFTPEELIAEGESVVSRWTGRGTHQGEFKGIPPTGKQVTVTGIVIHRIADGKFVEDREELDALGLLQQLGAVPGAVLK